MGLEVLWHMGATPSPTGNPALSNPLPVDVATRHAELVRIIAHLGHPWPRELDGYLTLVRAQEWGIVDRSLFGSDYPMWTPRAAVEGIRELGYGGGPPKVHDDTPAQLLEGNPLSALGLAQ